MVKRKNREHIDPRTKRWREQTNASPRIGDYPPRLLLGEDESTFRGLLTDELRKSGFIVETASTGTALLRAVESSLRSTDARPPYDLILTDIHMPGNPCVELSRVAPNPAMPPILLFTASVDESTRQQAFLLGAVRLLNRRADAQYLRQVVGGILN